MQGGVWDGNSVSRSGRQLKKTELGLTRIRGCCETCNHSDQADDQQDQSVREVQQGSQTFGTFPEHPDLSIQVEDPVER